MPDEGRFADDRLYYRRWSVPDARAHVIASHGFAEHSGRYDHFARSLNEASLSVWAPDHRGHGQSKGPRADIESVDLAVADLDLFVDLVEGQSGGRPIFLVGHSMGGLVAAAYAEAHQDRLAGLVLSGPLLRVDPGIAALADLEEIPDLGLADAVSRDPAVVAAYKADPLVHNGPPPRGFLQAAGQVDSVREALGGITVPVLVMHGSADLLVSPQALRDVVAAVASEDLTAIMWPGLWHEIFNEPEKDAVIGAVKAWVGARLAS